LLLNVFRQAETITKAGTKGGDNESNYLRLDDIVCGNNYLTPPLRVD
jgi:hypothetical protein